MINLFEFLFNFKSVKNVTQAFKLKGLVSYILDRLTLSMPYAYKYSKNYNLFRSENVWIAHCQHNRVHGGQ